MKKLVKLIKINNLQFNPNRDPQVYRRCAHENFRIQALLDGTGEATCKILDVTGRALVEKKVALPGMFSHEISFPTPGIRVVTLVIENGSDKYARDLRLDVMEHAWIE